MTVPAHVVDTNPEKDIAVLEADNDIFGEPVVLADYDTNPSMKVTTNSPVPRVTFVFM